MKKYTKGLETKRKLIQQTYRLLQENMVMELTVRRIAGCMGLSVSALYRYFDSFEEMISVASMRFMDDYMKEYAALLDRELDALDRYVEGWRIFNRYIFERPDIYYNLFWGSYDLEFSDIMIEYYELFPFSGSQKFPAHYYTLQFNGSLQERDYQAIHVLVNEKLITDQEAHYFSRISTLTAKGLLLECIDGDDKQRSQCRDECNQLLLQMLSAVFLRRDSL